VFGSIVLEIRVDDWGEEKGRRDRAQGITAENAKNCFDGWM
jgi:hypothetical protein